MNTDYRYQLENRKLTGHQPRKLTCPHCGKNKCFVRYIDTKNGFSYVADDVGKCDHEHSCGYHYKPSEYYRDHQWAVEPRASFSLESHCMPAPRTELIPLPAELVSRSHSPQSTFWQWLSADAAPRLKISSEDLQRIYRDYFIGATHQSDVIFWQIDEQLRVHTGHIMCYSPDGHRLASQSWTHFRMQQQHLLPVDYQPPKCLFGLHLLNSYTQRPVAIVESEKTALIMAAKMPEYLWMATAGCGGLNQEKTLPLRGRRLLLFPDSGCYEKWSMQMKQTEGLDYTISRHLEAYTANTDLADIYLGEARKAEPQGS